LADLLNGAPTSLIFNNIVNSHNFPVRNEGRTGALVEMPEPQRDLAQVPAECLNISLPQTQYEVHFRKRGTDKEKIVHSNSNKTFIDQGVLDKNTEYAY
jgi:hypothetical protein